ncbi:hypothetical protein MNBD_PLANCTO02-352 [hydrothermal vent metagenome]|uniref:Ethanolamine utilization protein EutN n=1 Tax=hydrothermal vent metagenome TaxID=652676 RepID=A0A3B1DY09_9ZZZZ
MQLATVIGYATSTVKHKTLEGWKLLAVQPLDAKQKPEGDPFLIIDQLGCRKGDKVIITSDGKAVREIMNSNNTPVRWTVLGLID